LGKLGITQFVESEKVKTMVATIEKTKTRQLTDIRNVLGENYSYTEIRFVLKHLEAMRYAD
jgi:uncharacterized protein YpbB